MKIYYLPLFSMMILINGCATQSDSAQDTNYNYQPPPMTITEGTIDSPDVILSTADRTEQAKDDAYDVDTKNAVEIDVEISAGDAGVEGGSRSKAAIIGATYGTGQGALYGTSTALNICGSAPILCPGAIILIPVFTVTGAIVGGTYGAVTGKSDF